MTKELAKKEKTEVVATAPEGAWGSENATSTDMIIPRILLIQAMSKMAQNDKIAARPGEIRGSLEANLLGGKDKPVSFIPFYTFNTWIKIDPVGNKFLGSEPRNFANEGKPLEETVNGQLVKNMKAISAYVLLESDLEKGLAFPYLLTFQATSFAAGKKLITLIKMLENFKKPPASKVFSLTSAPRENEKGKWFVFDLDQTGDSKPEQLMKAYEWYKIVSTQAVKVDEEVIEEMDAAEQPKQF